MNAKKIAEKLREIASFYGPDDGCTNAIYDALTDIANELDPPEPKPEPAYKVGDWVEYKGNQYRISAFGGEGMMFLENAIFALTPPYPVRKLDPSEVIVKIGCLEGTVEKAQDYAYFLLWHSKTDCDYSMIKWDALDTRTSELVESLLKAQEEK